MAIQDIAHQVDDAMRCEDRESCALAEIAEAAAEEAFPMTAAGTDGATHSGDSRPAEEGTVGVLFPLVERWGLVFRGARPVQPTGKVERAVFDARLQCAKELFEALGTAKLVEADKARANQQQKAMNIADIADAALQLLSDNVDKFSQLGCQFDAVVSGTGNVKMLASNGAYIAHDWSNGVDCSRSELEADLRALLDESVSATGTGSA